MYIFSKNKYALVTAKRHPQVVAFDPFPAVRGVWFTWIPVKSLLQCQTGLWTLRNYINTSIIRHAYI